MFDGCPVPPPLPDGPPIGPSGQIVLVALVCFSLVAVAYFFFEFSFALMDEDVWRDLKDFHRIYLRDWWRR